MIVTNVKNKNELAQTMMGLIAQVYQLAEITFTFPSSSDQIKTIVSIPDVTITKNNYNNAHYSELLTILISKALNKANYNSNLELQLLQFQKLTNNQELQFINSFEHKELTLSQWEHLKKGFQ